MVIIGCTPPGRFTEQHDVFFGIAHSLRELVPDMKRFWPEAKGRIHIDAWREVTKVDGMNVVISDRREGESAEKLFFLNLGGYRENEFEEYHYKVLATGLTMAEASKKAKQTAFYKHCGFKGAESHIDEKFGIDIDDAHRVADILAETFRSRYAIRLEPDATGRPDDHLHIGYVRIEKL
jgi:hypothetical protein